MSEDGGRVAFLADHNRIYRDGELYRDYGPRQVSFPLTLSGDGKVLVWRLRAQNEPGVRVVVNGVEGNVFLRTGLPVSSPDGSVVAYRASDSDDSAFIIANGRKISSSFEEVSDPAVSGDGRVVAYAAQGDGPSLFVGGKRVSLPEKAVSVFLNQDGSAWGYVTRTTVVTSQGRSEPFEEIRAPEFSPDAKRVAFAGRRGEKWFVVVGDRTFEAPGLVGDPVWSADGSRVGYGAVLGRDVWWKLIPLE